MRVPWLEELYHVDCRQARMPETQPNLRERLPSSVPRFLPQRNALLPERLDVGVVLKHAAGHHVHPPEVVDRLRATGRRLRAGGRLAEEPQPSVPFGKSPS